MKISRIKMMCLAGLLTAAVFLFTAYLHIPSHMGYTHIGDGFIYLAACLLPLPYAVFVGAGGAVLADCLTGFALWAPASLVVKAVTVCCFSRHTRCIVSRRNLVALLPAAVVCTAGYYLYEWLITGNGVAPLAGIPGYLTQSVLSSVLFIVLGAALDKLRLKDFLQNGGMSR